MKIQMIDLNDLYDKKYSYANNQGIGGVSISNCYKIKQ